MTGNKGIMSCPVSFKQAISGRDRKLYLGVFLAALVVRLALVGFLENKWYFYDTIHYHTAAESLIQGQGFGESVFVSEDGNSAYKLEPVYPIFLALVYLPFGKSLLAVRIVQAIVLSLIPILMFMIGSRLYGDRAGLIAAGIAVLYPYFVFLSGFLYPTGLATLFILLFVFHNLRFYDHGKPSDLLFVGAFLGLIVLTLPVALVLLPFWGLWIMRYPQKPIRPFVVQFALPFVCFVLTVTPWTIRNYLTFGKLVPIRAHAGHVGKLSRNLVMEELQRRAAGGDRFRVVMSTDEYGHHFDCYYNDEFKGRVSDSLKLFGNGDKLYSGVTLEAGLDNSIDRFFAHGCLNGSINADYKANDSVRSGAPAQMPNSKSTARLTSNSTQTREYDFEDRFDRTALGPNWTADPEYRIVDNKLRNTAQQGSWGFLAVNRAVTNPTEVAITWGEGTTNVGVNGTALALRLDSDSVNANGYMVWRGPVGKLRLWTLENGVPGRQVVKKYEALALSPSSKDYTDKLYDAVFQSPSTFLERYFSEFLHFWTPKVDRIKSSNQFTSSLTQMVGFVSFSAILILGTLGLVILKSGQWRPTILLLIVVFSFAFGYSFFMTQTRYRIPIEPYLILWAANGIVFLRNRLFKSKIQDV